MLENHTLITGCTSGIGRAIAEALATDYPLVLAARSEAKANELLAGLPNANRHRVWIHDLAAPENLEVSLTGFISKEDVQIVHFVHAAGIFELQAARSVDLESVHRQFNVNVFSATEIIRQLVRQKINRGALRTITLTSSINTRIGAKGFSVYAATKGALVSLARSLAVELAPTVRVNCVSPGAIETPGTQSLFADASMREAMRSISPLGFGSTNDIANAVAFLISEKARWITGQEFIVDGGRTLM